MCIILSCEKNVRPDRQLLMTCFSNNPDGAGIMWCEDGRVQTAKGFMSLPELEKAIDYVPMDSRLVIHMRIATSGGIDVGTCHPFPVCDDLDILHAPYVECDAALMHNGVIAHMPTDEKLGISDTVYFVQNIVNELYRGEVTNGIKRQIKDAAPNNRFALMTKDGNVYRMGDGWETVTKGIQASNSSWRFDKYLVWDYGCNDEYDDELVAAEDVWDFYCGACEHYGTCRAYGPYCDNVHEELKFLYESQLNFTGFEGECVEV